MYGISTRQFVASAAILRRVTLMAKFIRENHEDEFIEYWQKHYHGKADPGESLSFFKDGGFASKYYLMKVED